MLITLKNVKKRNPEEPCLSLESKKNDEPLLDEEIYVAPNFLKII